MKNICGLVLLLAVTPSISFAGQICSGTEFYPLGAEACKILLVKALAMLENLLEQPDRSFADVKKLALAQEEFFAAYNVAMHQNHAALDSIKDHKHVLDLEKSRQKLDKKIEDCKAALKDTRLIKDLGDMMSKYDKYMQLGGTKLPAYQSPDELFKGLKNNFMKFCVAVGKPEIGTK